MQKIIISMLSVAGLAGCYGEPLTFEPTPIAVERFYADTFQDQPFDEGPVSVLTEEHGELHTYLLTPCRNGARICGSRIGTFERTPDFVIVRGAYPGRTFQLSPGGDGFLVVNGQTISLAWNE